MNKKKAIETLGEDGPQALENQKSKQSFWARLIRKNFFFQNELKTVANIISDLKTKFYVIWSRFKAFNKKSVFE